MSQTQIVLNHLKKSPITSWQAIQAYGITRISARIQNLRDAGYNIKTEIKHNSKTHWASYSLAK